MTEGPRLLSQSHDQKKKGMGEEGRGGGGEGEGGCRLLEIVKSSEAVASLLLVWFGDSSVVLT